MDSMSTSKHGHLIEDELERIAPSTGLLVLQLVTDPSQATILPPDFNPGDCDIVILSSSTHPDLVCAFTQHYRVLSMPSTIFVLDRTLLLGVIPGLMSPQRLAQLIDQARFSRPGAVT
jgi:hypothetical protein